MNRTILFETALLRSRKAFEDAPYMIPLKSVITQIQYLLDVETGVINDRSLLNTVTVGQIAARDIDTFDAELSDLLYEVSAQAEKMK